MKLVYKTPEGVKLIDSVAQLAGSKPAKEIANELGIRYSQLKCIAQAHGISLKYSAIDEEDKDLIRALKRQYPNITYQNIGDKFGISLWTARNICMSDISVQA